MQWGGSGCKHGWVNFDRHVTPIIANITQDCREAEHPIVFLNSPPTLAVLNQG